MKSGALQCPHVLTTPGLPAGDDFKNRTSVVHGCICSLLRTWEAKQYSSTMRETDPSLIAGRRKMAGLNTVPHCSVTDGEADTKHKCPGATGLDLVTQDVLLLAFVCHS